MAYGPPMQPHWLETDEEPDLRGHYVTLASGPMDGTIRLEIEAWRYLGSFLTRRLFALRCEDGKERRAWVDLIGWERETIPAPWDAPMLTRISEPRMLWEIRTDSPEIMDLAHA
jgi:hypothetical protein